MILQCLPAQIVMSYDNTPTINIDMTNEDHEILHGSAGFLYGISNEGVPDINTLTPLKPKVLATKGALGTEHPYGDALDVADEFFESGGEQIQMYNSNYYGVFGVTANAYEYGNVLQTVIAPYVADWKNTMREKYPDIDSRMVYIPINEGTPVNGVSNFNEAWKIYYNAIKASDPQAVIAGPNDAVYRGHNSMYDFLKYCRDNNCLPDIVTWHELQVSCLNTMGSHMSDYRNICSSLGIEEKQIVINEYADYSDCGVPGRLVNWIARLEDNRVYGCLPFWHQANNLNDLTANSNDGNGAWWVYKWYGDMSGSVLKLTTENTTYDKFYALATIDENKQSASVIVGGNDGKGKINLNSISKTSVFKNAETVHVKIEESCFTGYHGVSGEPKTVAEGIYPVINGSVTIDIDNMLFSTAYKITVTKTASATPYLVKSNYRASYEAEDALSFGNLIYEQESSPIEKPRYFCSGRTRVGDFDSYGDGIEYTVTIPYSGLYKLSFIYGNGVGSTRNNAETHAPKNITQDLFIDGVKSTLHLPNTLFYSMEGMAEKYISLEEGTHSIKLMYSGDSGAFHDVLYVSYAGAFGEAPPVFDKTYQSEDADFNPNSLSNTQNDIYGFSGSGYIADSDKIKIENMGGVRHVVHVEESGLYSVLFRYLSYQPGKIRLFLDNTNKTFTNHLTDISFEKTEDWSQVYTTIFLRKGLNIIDCDTTVPAFLDYMRVVKSSKNLSLVCEAEDASGTFTTLQNGETSYIAPLAGDENAHLIDGKYIDLKVNVHSDGLYKMQVFQSNNDLCGTHSYNIKIIDRYASFMVNGEAESAKRYFFPNTFSDDSFEEKTIPLNLTAGDNTIRIYNDDSWQVKWGGSTSEPGTNELLNYTPNFDKFIITPAVADLPLEHTGHKIDVLYTDNGYAYSDKTYADTGDSVTIYLVPKGGIKSLTLNGEELSSTLKTDDGNLYYTTARITGSTEIIASFSDVQNDDFIPDSTSPSITLDGKIYQIIGENLYPDPSFADNSGSKLSVWYVGSNITGHPSDSSYQIPKINPDGTLTNLTSLSESGYLTKGAFEKDAPDTFYFGKDNSNTYLVEHMASDWRHCAWNGNKSLLSFVPIKENTNYHFSFDAYTVSGMASVRFGAIDMDEGENFYVPSSYATADSLNFTSSAFDCTNGDIQNVGGNWQTYTLTFNSGKGADYFLFNAYWLQMAEYLCIGNFKLYELSSEANTKLTDIEKLPAQSVIIGDAVSLPDYCTAYDDNSAVSVSIKWLNSDSIDTNSCGTYNITGELIPPDGYYLTDKYINLRIVVTHDVCSVANWTVNSSETALSIKGYKDTDASLIVAAYQSGLPKSVTSYDISIEKGKTTTETIPIPQGDRVMVFVWNKSKLLPLCDAKTIK